MSTVAGAAAGAGPHYHSGFGNHFASEALPGALPQEHLRLLHHLHRRGHQR